MNMCDIILTQYMRRTLRKTLNMAKSKLKCICTKIISYFVYTTDHFLAELTTVVEFFWQVLALNLTLRQLDLLMKHTTDSFTWRQVVYATMSQTWQQLTGCHGEETHKIFQRIMSQRNTETVTSRKNTRTMQLIGFTLAQIMIFHFNQIYYKHTTPLRKRASVMTVH